MSTALYRRYRPDSFAEMIGQEHVTGPLMQALRSNRVNHAYLFSGPRGCGKTTSARILARILNCAQNTEANPTDSPCGQCPSCIDLARGGSGSLDVVEIDAASHGGVDDARDLRERATFSPSRDRFKIFILDEAHMVTAQGFNALLKIVEEPPPYLKFIFATTEPEKVIGTIRSRTHHYPFKLVAPEIMHNYLIELCKAEGIIAKDGVLPLVVRAGAGSVRDTLSVLDQLIAGSAGGVLEYELAVALLGFTPSSLLDEVVEALGQRDGGRLFRVVEQVVGTGHEPRRFVEDLLERLRDLIVIALSGDNAAAVLPGVPSDQLARMHAQANSLGAAELSRSADIVNSALTEMSGATSPRLHLELLCARLLLPAADNSAGGLGARLDGLERAIANGSVAGFGAAPNTGVNAAPNSAAANARPNSSAAADPNATPVATTAAPVAVPSASATPGVVPSERKSLRPDSTRRKPAAEASAPAVSETSVAPVVPGSMFAAAQTTAAAPGTAAISAAAPANVAPVTTAPGTAVPETAAHPASVQQVAPAGEPALPENVGQYAGPRDEQGRPLAANTGWHTAQSREPNAPQNLAAAAPIVTAPIPAQAPPTQQVSAPAAPTQAPVTPAAQQIAEQAVAQQIAEPAAAPQATEHAAPVVAPAGSTNQTETFKLRWAEVLDAFSASHRAAGAFTKQFASVAHLSADTLYLSAPNPGLVQNLVSRGAEQGIAQAVQQTLGFPVTVVIDVEGSDRFPKAESSANNSVAAPDQNPTGWSSPAAAPEVEPAPEDLGHSGSGFPHEEFEHAQAADTTPSTANDSAGFAVSEPAFAAPEVAAPVANSPAPTAHTPADSTPATPHEAAYTPSDSAPATPHEAAYTPSDSAPATPHEAAYVQAPEPAPYDPMASVNIFGAAVGAFASARSVSSPDLPRIGATAQNVISGIQTPHAPAEPVSEGSFEPAFPHNVQSGASDWSQSNTAEPSTTKPSSTKPSSTKPSSTELNSTAPNTAGSVANGRDVNDFGAQENTASQYGTVQSRAAAAAAAAENLVQQSPEPAPSAQPHASTSPWNVESNPAQAPEWAVETVPPTPPVANPHSATDSSAMGGTRTASPAQAATVPPWEETPRQAAERRAAEQASREATRQKIVDDPQPDDEDLDASNLVGVPLVMSMFGATIIDEINEYS